MRVWHYVACVLVGCAPHVSSSSVATRDFRPPSYAGQVQVSALEDPPQSTQLGIVEAHSQGGNVTVLVPALQKKAAELGGNFVVVDNIKTKYEMHTSTQRVPYQCGGPKTPMTCYRTQTTTTEVAICTVVGRAFRTEKVAP